MSHSSPLTIRLIRSLPSDSKEDDIIRVRRNSDTDSYDMEYIDSCPDGKKIIQNFHDVSFNDVVEYLRCILENCVLDEEGFHSIQIDPIGMPRCLVSINSLRQPAVHHYDSAERKIMSSIEMTLLLMKNQVKKDRAVTPPPVIRRRRAGFYDASPVTLDFADE